MSHRTRLPRLAGELCRAVVPLLLLCFVTADATAEGKKYAFLAGVKTYDDKELEDLKYPENDVEEVGNVLRAAGFEVVLLTSGKGTRDRKLLPTHENVERELKALLAKAKKDDVVLVGLAGHGQFIEKTGESFFCPSDAKPDEEDAKKRRLISLQDLYDRLGRCGAQTKFLLVDACRNSTDKARGRSGATGSKAPKPPKGVAALYSCSERERAWEHDNYRHGVFFYHVIQALKGKARNSDGEVTWDDLTRYVRRQVPRDARLLKPGETQTPSLNAGELAGEPPVLVGKGIDTLATPSLAIRLRTLTADEAEAAGLRAGIQPVVDAVIPGGGGDRMGLLAEDLILRVNGQNVPTARQLRLALGLLSFGELVEMQVLRKGKKVVVKGKYSTTIGPAERFRRVKDQAADDPASMCLLGDLYRDGDGVAADPKEAAACYRKAALSGHAGAMHQYARILMGQLGGKKLDSDEAKEFYKWLKKAADRDDLEAQMLLSEAYQRGIGVDKNEKAGKELIEKAAARGFPAAQTSKAHGMIFSIPTKQSKDKKIELDMEKYKPQLAAGVALLEKAAEQDEPSAQYNLWFVNSTWVFYENKDPKKAVAWLKKAAGNGHARAQRDLGGLLETGKDWLGNDVKEQYKLTKDPKEAFAWYLKAALQNDVEAIEHVARCYARGIGVQAEPKRAVTLFKALAGQRVASSMYQLGLLYEEGLGVEKSKEEAITWYKKAVAGGNEAAKKKLKDLGQ